jgi:hypothetical protein
MGEETRARWKAGSGSGAEFYVSSTMTASVESRYSYCRLCEDSSPPGDRGGLDLCIGFDGSKSYRL